MVLQGALSKYLKDSNFDYTGLGRWSWVKLEGELGHVTSMVTAYAPCGSRASRKSACYKQQLRYIEHYNLRTDVKKMFQDELLVLRQ